MNLFDMFRKSKKVSEPGYLGRMWACVVKCQPWSDPGQRYGVKVKNVGIVEAFVRDDETHVVSDEWNPFNGGSGRLVGPVGYLKYVHPSNIWIGFFETEDKAKEGYRRFADALKAEIESASVRLGLAGETRQAPSI